MDHELVGILLTLAAVLGIVLLNAFFVATEFSMVSARRTRMQELADEGSRNAKLVLVNIDDPNRFVVPVQIGVTMSSLALGAIGEPTVAKLIEPLFGNPSHGLSYTITLIIAFGLITYLHVVLGEIVPKNIALQMSERIALATARPINLFYKVTYPLIFVLNGSAEVLLRWMGITRTPGLHMIHSEEELKMLVSQSSKGGVLQDAEQEMLYNVFDFADKEVAEVMVPRPDVVALPVDEAPAALLQRVIEQPYTRYPVYRETMDDIAGILHIRDLFKAAERYGKDRVKVESLLRPAHVVPESKSLAGLLTDFRRSKSHMALVVDEYGSLAGIVTLEDLLEEIVGEIADEYDVPEVQLERIAHNHLRLDGKYPVGQLNEQFGLDIPEDDYHTIGGFVFGLLGQQPHEGDVVLHDGLRLEVTETDGPRIVHVDLIMLEKHSQAAPEGDPGEPASASAPNGPK